MLILPSDSVKPATVSRPTVLIYRDQLLPYSETFIPAQAESLTQYRPLYVGASRLGQFAIPDTRQVILGELVRPAKLWKLLYKFGRVVHPRWLAVLSQASAQLMHAHFGGDGGFAIPLARRLNIPLVVTFHGYDATWSPPYQGFQPADVLFDRGRFFRTLLLQKRNQTFQAAQQIIAVSHFIRDQLILRGCPAEKIKVHYIGIDVETFTPDPSLPREPTVLFVGRLVEKKGCAYVIRAMAEVQRQCPEAKLVVIGDGALRSQLEQDAAQTLSHTQFLGAQPPAVVRDWMNRAYCLCGPSITAVSGDAEGLGMVFLEAQAMALPVVAFASGGVPEAVRHGETGLLSPEKDLEALTRDLLQLFQFPEIRQKFAQAGRHWVEQSFNLIHNTQGLEQIYDQLQSAST